MKVVGEIKPPDYKDPAQMLRNIADDIEKGEYGEVHTIVVGLSASEGYNTFGGGRDSSLEACGFVLGACAARLHNIPWGVV